MIDPSLTALVAEFHGKDKQDVMLAVMALRDEIAQLRADAERMRNVLLRIVAPFDAARSAGMPIGKVSLTHDSKLLADIRTVLDAQRARVKP